MIELFIALLLVFPFWATIHELSHILVAKLNLGSIAPWEIILWPHKYEGRFYWARCSYMAPSDLSSQILASISAAPRLAALVVAMPFLILEFFFPWALVFVMGAIIDIFVGTLGLNPESDLQREARGGTNIWKLRWENIGIMTALIAGVIAGVIKWL